MPSSKHLCGLCVLLTALLLGACATTPEQQQREEERSRTIESILTEASEFSEAERCLGSNQYRSIRILDDQHILFEGRGGKTWLNTLPMRCPGLQRNSAIRIERLGMSSRLCRLDSFEVYDWIDWPWYRRWPWHWTGGPRCSLGDFQPVNEVQVQALKDALKQR